MLRVLTFVIAMLAATSSWANVLTPDDQVRVENFLQKASTFAKDLSAVTNAATASRTVSCLLNLMGPTEQLLGVMDAYRDWVAMDVAMVDPRDEGVVLGFLKSDTRTIPNIIATGRRLTNSIMGRRCASNRLVTAKGQELLRLYDDATSLIQGISKKLGR